uniref:Thioesterase domain-containing protein n=1 Tax=Lotus japonicus TaxID=34305 RepID=I3SCH7_LOTJA|nr:unknown [Lotus japonicus]
MDPQHASNTLVHLRKLGMAQPVPESCNTSGFYSHFYESFIKVDHIQRGRISCTVPVKPAISNDYGTLHGGAVGSLVELLSIGCARTVVAEDRELFLGEINISYLSGVPTNVADVFTKTISQFTGAISIPGCQSWIA